MSTLGTCRCLDSLIRSALTRANISTAAMLVTLIIASPCKATNRYFHDIRVVSENHRYVVEATSPDNVDGRWRRPFQSRFVYRLTDQTENRQLWMREQAMKDNGTSRRQTPVEGAPAAVYVSDEGWVVIRTVDFGGPIELIAISREGKETARVRLFDMIPRDNKNFFRYASLSTAGWRWGARYCHFYFTSLNSTPCFCLRAWWGERLVIDLVTGKKNELGANGERELFSVEKQFVLKTLTGTSDWEWTTAKGRHELSRQADQPAVRDGMLAIHMAGKMKLREAVPYLRALEDCLYVGTTTGSNGPYKSASDGIEPYSYESLTIRQLSQLSLRLIGERPSGHQTTKLYRRGDGFWYPDDPISIRRETRVGEIIAGLTPEQVLARIGAPDFIESKIWEYDIDDATPYTLRIEWGESGIEKVSRQSPPKWSDGITRDRSLAL